MRLIASLLAVALVVPAAARAENPRLQAAIRLYQRAELEAAMAELKAAEEQVKDEGDLVKVLIYRGLIYSETGQSQQMMESFKRALAMRPWEDVPQDTSPRLAKLFADARREVWGSPGIKPWPKKAGNVPSKTVDIIDVKPAEPPPSSTSSGSSTGAPTVTPSNPPAAAPATEKPASGEGTAPANEPKATPPPPKADDAPDVPPTK
jgi:tetratricopeptide (TPR) repeat protein